LGCGLFRRKASDTAAADTTNPAATTNTIYTTTNITSERRGREFRILPSRRLHGNLHSSDMGGVSQHTGTYRFIVLERHLGRIFGLQGSWARGNVFKFGSATW
jgi:hypothetical protein